MFNALGEEAQGQTIGLGGDGRYFNKEAAQIILKLAAGNGIKKVRKRGEGTVWVCVLFFVLCERRRHKSS